MENSMYSIGNLRSMEVIDISSGSKLGYIKDLKIDTEEYKILSLLLPNYKATWFSKSDSIEISWDRVRKVGIDVILVEAKDLLSHERE